VGTFDAQVTVIGAGPAGAGCAAFLARAGLAVLLLEARGAEAQPKLCAGLLNRRAQRLLDDHVPVALQLNPEQPDLEYHDLDNRIRARYFPEYLNIDRRAFDDWQLSRASAAGAQVQSGTQVGKLVLRPERVELVTTSGVLRSQWVVDASGWAAFARQQLGGTAPRRLNCLQGEVRLNPPPGAAWAIYRSACTPFFGWIVAKGAGRFIVGAGLPPRSQAAAPPPRFVDAEQQAAADQESWPPAWQPLAPYLQYLQWRGHKVELLADKPRGAPLTWISGLKDLWWGQERVYAVGEAAGLVSPFSGDGLSYALASAQAVAHAISSEQPPAALPGLLIPELNRLRMACVKAYIGATALLRPWGLMLLPIHTGQRLTYLPWRLRNERL